MSSAGSYGSGGSGMSGVLTITGDSGLTVTGNVTLKGLTSGSGIAFIGTSTTALQVQIDYLAMSDAASDGSAGFLGVLGSGTIIAPWGGISSGNMFIGPQAGNPAVTGTQNIGIGQLALNQIQNASNNIAIGGGGTAQGCISLTDNVAIGYQALAGNGGLGATGLGANVAVGNNALRNGTAMVDNIAIGFDAGINYAASESSNILIGNDGTASENNTIRIGTDGSGPAQQNACFVAGIYGESVGVTNAAVFIDNTGKLGTVGGSGGGVSSITGNSGGAQTGAITLTGGTSGAIFTGSTGTITESFNFLNMADTNSGGTTGYLALNGTPILAAYGGVGNSNIFLGSDSGIASTTGVGNTFVGALSGAALTTGDLNTGIGTNSLHAVTSGGTNTAIGNSSGNAITTGQNNTAVGTNSLEHLTTTNNNTAIGRDSLISLVTGSTNIAVGYQAANSYTGSESNNIIIGNTGTASESNVIRIGAQGSGTAQQNACFIAGITGVTVASSAAVLIDTATGQLGTVVSAERYKENIHDMGSDSHKILTLRPVSFSYKSDPKKQKRYGLIAEEVEKVMPHLVSYNKEGLPETVQYHELCTFLLNEVQRLTHRVQSLEDKFSARPL